MSQNLYTLQLQITKDHLSVENFLICFINRWINYIYEWNSHTHSLMFALDHDLTAVVRQESCYTYSEL